MAQRCAILVLFDTKLTDITQHGTEGNVNDALFKERTPLDNVVPNRSAAESIERQVEEKGRVPDKPDDRQLDDMDEMNNKLSGRPGFKH